MVISPGDFSLARRGWLAWLRVNEPALALSAYQHGARTGKPRSEDGGRSERFVLCEKVKLTHR